MTVEYIVHPYADLWPLLPNNELQALADDIRVHGLREPIWLHPDGRIVDGRNRYRACALAGVEPATRTYEGTAEGLLAFLISLNMARRHMDDSQRSIVAAKIANLGHGQRSDRVDTAIAVSQAEAAERMNVSVDSLQRGKKVLEQAVPELVEAVESGRVSVSAAAGLTKAPAEEQRKVADASKSDSYKETQAAIAEARSQIEWRRMHDRPEPVREPLPVPDGKYRAFVIDPPWPMQKIEREERPGQGSALDYPTMDVWCTQPLSDGQGCFLLAENGYEPCESIECVVGNVVSATSMNDCHIYLWVTHKFLPDGLRLLESWGFDYQCVMTWRKNVGITPFSWMYDTEHVLFGRKGNLKLQRLGMRLSFEAPVRGHSVKPDVFYERVIDATPGPRLEMFARSGREGFVGWGNEAPDVVV